MVDFLVPPLLEPLHLLSTRLRLGKGLCPRWLVGGGVVERGWWGVAGRGVGEPCMGRRSSSTRCRAGRRSQLGEGISQVSI
jgi:hypothetical protein